MLLYGPPGCGKTLIAKAVANSLAKKVAASAPARRGKSYFLNIKGPELLNKYVGETERHIRLVFQRAREKASEGTPVIVFFDEMDSLFRTRGSGVSSDVENTIVPQLLSEIDGVETLENVLVIGASNREDMIDPAILRPGPARREDQDRAPRRRVGPRHLLQVPHRRRCRCTPTTSREFGGDKHACVAGMIQATVERMYTETEENRFLEVTYANGDKEVLYFKDFNSGAMIQNIVDRAKKMAIKDLLDNNQKGLRVTHMLQACVDEFKENEDLPEHHQPRRLGPHLRQEGRADRVHPHAHHRQAGHRAGPLDRHRLEHRSVPLRRGTMAGGATGRAAGRRGAPGGAARARSVVRRGAGGLVRRAHRAGRRRSGWTRASRERRHDRGQREGPRATRQFALGIVSLGAGIPITAISAAVTATSRPDRRVDRHRRRSTWLTLLR